MTSGLVIEIVLRGGAAALLVLLAVHALVRAEGHPSARLGALFALGTASYALISSPAIYHALGPVRPPILLLAMFNSVFFWWFANALFDDRFRWRFWHWGPLVVLAASFAPRFLFDVGGDDPYGTVVRQAIVAAMMIHALVLAIRDLGDDLVGARRRFRVAFAVLVGVTGLVIAGAEIYELGGEIPARLREPHALALFALSLGFVITMTTLRRELIWAPAPATPAAAVPAADRADLDRLEALMADGAFREPGLTVAGLAERVGVPEHRLRKLINQGLGYRNFSTFLNDHRTDAAQAELSDPSLARTQILQITFGLGYGSLAPFNRAFRERVGQSPSEFRKQADADRN